MGDRTQVPSADEVCLAERISPCDLERTQEYIINSGFTTV